MPDFPQETLAGIFFLKGESQGFSGDFILTLMSLTWLRKIYEKFYSRAVENQKNITKSDLGEETKI